MSFVSTSSGSLPGATPGAIADSKHVRVHGDGELAERDVQHDVRGLAAHAGKRLQRLARARHFAAVLVEQDLRERDDVLRLAAIEADRADVLLESLDAERRDLSRACWRRDRAWPWRGSRSCRSPAREHDATRSS
jgi:hypothetical protein